MRFETGPGEQAQVDWGSSWVWMGAERVRVHVFMMVLGFSRRIFARGYRRRAWSRCSMGMSGPSSTSAAARRRSSTTIRGRSCCQRRGLGRCEVEREVQGPDGLLRGQDPSVPVLPGADQGQGGERGEVRQAQCPAGRRFADLEALNAWLWSGPGGGGQGVHGTTHEQPASASRVGSRGAQAVDARRRRRRSGSRAGSCRGTAGGGRGEPLPGAAKLGGPTGARCGSAAEEIVLGRDGDEMVRHGRLLGKHQVARGTARRAAGRRRGGATARRDSTRPTWPGGEVDVRSLADYAQSEVAPVSGFGQIEQIQEQMRQLEAGAHGRGAADAARGGQQARALLQRLSRRALRPRDRRQARAAHRDEDDDGALPVPEDARELRLQISALDRAEGGARAGHRPLPGRCGQRAAARAPRRRQDAPGRGARSEGLRPGLPHGLHHRGGADRDPRRRTTRTVSRRS